MLKHSIAGDLNVITSCSQEIVSFIAQGVDLYNINCINIVFRRLFWVN